MSGQNRLNSGQLKLFCVNVMNIQQQKRRFWSTINRQGLFPIDWKSIKATCSIPTAPLPVLLAVIKQFTDPRCLSPSHSFMPIKKTRRVWGIHKKRFTNNPDYNPWCRECEWRDRRRRTDPKIIRSKNRPSLLLQIDSARFHFLFIHHPPVTRPTTPAAAFNWSDWLAGWLSFMQAQYYRQ